MDTLVTHTFNFDRALEAYKLVLAGTEEMLGVVLEYPLSAGTASKRIDVTARKAAVPIDHVGVGVIGAGDFAASTILPALAALDDVSIVGIASASGRSAVALAGKYGAAYATTDIAEILNDQAVSLVVIATRHGLHAEQTVAALEAGKHVHVEKPLATTMEGLAEVAEALRSAPGMLHVGFNRRFSPAAERIVQHFRARSTPLLMQARINAGAIPASHWVHDPVEGGGRLIGEVCHFVDLLAMFAGSLPTAVSAVRLPPDAAVLGDDNAIVTLEFAGGSVGTILYSALGPGKMSKEYFELVGEGKSVVLDDFRSLSLYEGDSRVLTTGKQDKGQRAQFASLVRAVRAGGPPPIPAEELLTTSLATLLIEKAMGTRASTPVLLSMLDSPSTADTAEGA
jgi:predicted dehydrogenase